MTLRQATLGGVLAIGDVTLTCYVLEDRMRVLGQDALLKAFGQTPRAKGRDWCSPHKLVQGVCERGIN